MAMARMPGSNGPRQYNEGTRQFAVFMIVVVLVLFFALAIRSLLDKNSEKAPLVPTRNPSKMIRSLIKNE